MSLSTGQQFYNKATQKAFDVNHRKRLAFNINRYDTAVLEGKKQWIDLETTRTQAQYIKKKAIDNLGLYLLEFEKNITQRGAQVLWAKDSTEALAYIGAICKEVQARSVVKSKSMVTEEIHLNEYLESIGVQSIETDLGEFIQQLDGEPPYHIVTPAMHKSKEDVAKLYHDKLGTPLTYTPIDIAAKTRQLLRNKFAEAEIGISGGNFLIADVGAVVVTENEGNARLSLSLPKTHIAIVGIEKILPSIQDLALFLPLLATFGTGQKVTVYNSIISGPRQVGEVDGPEQMYVILLDNGRTKLLEDTRLRESLQCIRCGACLNICPVYKSIGGHAYQTTYSGPIGEVISPTLKGIKEFNHLSYASSLCGSCTSVCPVKINIHELILYNRQLAVAHRGVGWIERLSWYLWEQSSLNRTLMNQGTSSIKNFVVNKVIKGWSRYRQDIRFSDKSFNQLWKDAQDKK
ncbi:MAG: LutB/LldF family L-lactate oxidation iron-sulfur protein [Phycisphaerales bacterium]|nr:LutB/LldF family L-lactate oxidation iron-sulfur protein [Phycisphaerales bacterium]